MAYLCVQLDCNLDIDTEHCSYGLSNSMLVNLG